MCIISIYSVFNAFSEYIYFCISKKITSFTILLVFKIAKSAQCILKSIKVHISDSFSVYFIAKSVPTWGVYLTLGRIRYTSVFFIFIFFFIFYFSSSYFFFIVSINSGWLKFRVRLIILIKFNESVCATVFR